MKDMWSPLSILDSRLPEVNIQERSQNIYNFNSELEFDKKVIMR